VLLVWIAPLLFSFLEIRAVTQLFLQPPIHVDETSFRVNKKKHWIHVASSGDITLKFLHQKRGKVAIEEIGIIPRYGGVIIHDCWSSYLSYTHCGHGLCGSHILRELTFVVETNSYQWAIDMKSLLQKTCFDVSKSDNKCLTESEFSKLQSKYREILARGKKELPPMPVRPSGKRGRLAKSDAHNLWE